MTNLDDLWIFMKPMWVYFQSVAKGFCMQGGVLFLGHFLLFLQQWRPPKDQIVVEQIPTAGGPPSLT